ncbi:hypothetical protein [Halorhodospira halochloris]|uniref:hypothetical protein n=1 Tax=Halorhodospira halochloris TaxID=1052 RepID=UPI0013A55CC8|nr:hypothetical protein [Halorhodospira halochloris]
MSPSLEPLWRPRWRQHLHTGADDGSGEAFRGALLVPVIICSPPLLDWLSGILHPFDRIKHNRN